MEMPREIPMEICRHARELYWGHAENAISGPSSSHELRRLLAEGGPHLVHALSMPLPRGRCSGRWRPSGGGCPDEPTDHVAAIERACTASEHERVGEHESVAALQRVLRGRTEETVLIVCHWGVIKELCGVQVDNGVLVECERSRLTGELSVVALHTCESG